MQIFSTLESISIGALSLAELLEAALFLVAALIIIKILNKLVARALERSKLERAAKGFVRSAVRIVLLALAFIITADRLGIPTTSLVALFSVAGLALSLSMQELLKNLFSGMTILSVTPFVSGDFVDVGDVSGTISEVGLFYTTMNTTDNKAVYIPNSEITTSKILNYSREPQRRLDMTFPASYDSPAKSVKAALLEAVEAEGRILSEPAPFCGISEYGAGAVTYTIRVWVKNADYYTLRFALNEAVREAFERNGVKMTAESLNVNIIN